MLEPADVLLLDEPTNDLDIPSLEVLEQALLEFPGAIVLISHDRFLLERVCTEFVALDGSGRAAGHASLDHWQRAAELSKAQVSASVSSAKRSEPSTTATSAMAKPRRLSFKEQREMEGMEQGILEAEASVSKLEVAAADPANGADHVRAATVYQQLHEAQDKVKTLYERWAELDALRT